MCAHKCAHKTSQTSCDRLSFSYAVSVRLGSSIRKILLIFSNIRNLNNRLGQNVNETCQITEDHCVQRPGITDKSRILFDFDNYFVEKLYYAQITIQCPMTLTTKKQTVIILSTSKGSFIQNLVKDFAQISTEFRTI